MSWVDGCVSGIEPVISVATGLLLSSPVDLHVHLDKSYTVDDVGASRGDLQTAIELMRRSRAGWTETQLHARMTHALEDAWHCGTRAMRTHLDWSEPQTPLSLAVFASLREQWRGRIELQLVSLTSLDVFDADDGAAARARTLVRSGGILGAFVYRNEDLDAKLARVFEVAVGAGLDLDFHVDEGLAPEATALRRIADLTLQHGWRNRVTCGHACSLSVQPVSQARKTLERCAQAGINLVALPTTNLYLQGAWDVTPLERGITRLREAAAAGVNVSIATDNVADCFYPYGSYDLIETFGLGVQVAHLTPALDWLSAITTHPARAMGLAWDGLLRVGGPADMVVLAARTEYEMLTPAGRQRTVYRGGARTV